MSEKRDFFYNFDDGGNAKRGKIYFVDLYTFSALSLALKFFCCCNTIPFSITKYNQVELQKINVLVRVLYPHYGGKSGFSTTVQTV